MSDPYNRYNPYQQQRAKLRHLVEKRDGVEFLEFNPSLAVDDMDFYVDARESDHKNHRTGRVALGAYA